MAVTAQISGKFWDQYIGPHVVDKTSTDQWWLMCHQTTTDEHHFYYSNDQGDTWTEDTGAAVSTMGSREEMGAMFIDADDQVWHVYITASTEVTIRVGTISGNAITWDGTVKTITNYSNGPLDIIAWPESTGTRVAVSHKILSNSHWVTLWYWNGSAFSDDQSVNHTTSSLAADSALDFSHTGDGKTPTATPHIHICRWTSGNVYYTKLVESSGTWSANSQRTITSAGAQSYAHQIGGFYFDGTSSVFVFENTSGQTQISERDEADTSTTVISTAWSGAGLEPADGVISAAYDPATRDIYIISMNEDDDIGWTYWDRSADYWGSHGWRTFGGSAGVTTVLSNPMRWMAANNVLNFDDFYVVIYDSSSIKMYRDTIFEDGGWVSHGEAERNATIDRTSDGTMWTTVHDGISWDWFYFSKDNGVTWRNCGTKIVASSSSSFFIDADDYMHVATKSGSTTKYWRGTVASDVWTFAGETTVLSSGGGASSNTVIIAHREGTGWKAHLIENKQTASVNNWQYYARMDITSGGTITNDVDNHNIMDWGTNGPSVGSGYSYSTLDWNHDGGGKLVNGGGDPDLFIGLYRWHSSGNDAVNVYACPYDSGNWGTSDDGNAGWQVGSTMTDLTQFGTIDLVFDGTLIYVAFTKSGSPYREVWSVDPSDGTDTDLSIAAIGASQTTEERAIFLIVGGGNVYVVANDTDDHLWTNFWNGSSWDGWTEQVTDPILTSAGYTSTNRWSAGYSVEVGFLRAIAVDYDWRYFQILQLAVPSGGVGWGIAL